MPCRVCGDKAPWRCPRCGHAGNATAGFGYGRVRRTRPHRIMSKPALRSTTADTIAMAIGAPVMARPPPVAPPTITPPPLDPYIRRSPIRGFRSDERADSTDAEAHAVAQSDEHRDTAEDHRQILEREGVDLTGRCIRTDRHLGQIGHSEGVLQQRDVQTRNRRIAAGRA